VEREPKTWSALWSSRYAFSPRLQLFVTVTGCVHFVQGNKSLTKSSDNLLAALL